MTDNHFAGLTEWVIAAFAILCTTILGMVGRGQAKICSRVEGLEARAACQETRITVAEHEHAAVKESLNEIKASITVMHSRITKVNTANSEKLDQLLKRGK